MWDTVDDCVLGTITPPPRQGSTLRSVTMSKRHVFLGSSRGEIFVYSAEKVEATMRPNPFIILTLTLIPTSTSM